MRIKIKSIMVATATFTMSFMLTQAPASYDQSEVPDSDAQLIANLDGNPDCQAISNNSDIMEVKVRRAGWSGSLPLDGLQTVDYSVSQGGVLSWSVETNGDSEPEIPINSVIISSKNGYQKYSNWDGDGKSDKSQKSKKSKRKGNMGVRVYHFGDAGATSDDGETGRGKTITKIRFCYGLTAEPPMATIESIPMCGEEGTVLQCPDDSSGPMVYNEGSGEYTPATERLLISLNIGDPNFGLNETTLGDICSCNVQFQACDPNIPAGEENSCILLDQDEGGPEIAYLNGSESENGGELPSGVNERAPLIIQGVETPNSYVCYTFGSRRFCFNHPGPEPVPQ